MKASFQRLLRSRTLPFFLQFSVIIIYLILLNNCLGQKEVVITSDGKGYYDYLPATFIYNDLNFGYLDTLKTQHYDHKQSNEGINPTINGHKVNKYYCGVALLNLPFFLAAHTYARHSEHPADGYSRPYQQGVFVAAIFYLTLGIIFIRKLLRKMNYSVGVILTVQLFIVLGTGLIQYSHANAAYSHVYSFSLISMFCYYIYRFIKNGQISTLALASFVLGLIVVVRPINVLCLLFVPFIAGSAKNFFRLLKKVFADHWTVTAIALLLFLFPLSIQSCIWYEQTGSIYVYPYGEEGFNLLHPRIHSFLFDMGNGFFVYAPVLLIILTGSVLVMIRTRDIYRVAVVLVALFILIWILSSWWCWSYGASYGARPMVDYYAIFAILMALFLKELKKRYVKWILGSVGLCLIVVNFTQAYQYQNFILASSGMTIAKYTKVFLKTDKRYEGYLFHEKPGYEPQDTLAAHKTAPVGLALGPGEHSGPFKYALNTAETRTANFVQINCNLCTVNGFSEIILSGKTQQNETLYWHKWHTFKGNGKEHYCGPAEFYFHSEAFARCDSLTVEFASNTEKLKINNIRLYLLAL